MNRSNEVGNFCELMEMLWLINKGIFLVRIKIMILIWREKSLWYNNVMYYNFI